MGSRFEKLPPELLDRICRNFEVSYGSYSLCLTSRACRAVAYHNLYREPNLTGAGLVLFTRSILQNHSLASSVTAIHICAPENVPANDLNPEHVKYFQMYALGSKIYTLSQLARISRDTAHGRIYCYVLIIELLLMHLHNAVEISIGWQSRLPLNLFEGTREIGNAQKLLPRLSHVSFKNCDPIMPPQISGQLGIFSELLSRCTPESLRAEGISQFQHHTRFQKYVFNSIISIDLVNCQCLDTFNLDQLIVLCPNVQRFSFSILPDLISSRHNVLDEIASDHVLQSLDRVAHSLQYLSLRINGREAVQTLQNFVALEHLKISGLDLIEYSENGNSKFYSYFIEKLPSSLRTLHICCLDILSISISEELTQLSKAKKVFPNLQTVILSGDRTGSYERGRADFEASGLVYVIHK